MCELTFQLVWAESQTFPISTARNPNSCTIHRLARTICDAWGETIQIWPLVPRTSSRCQAVRGKRCTLLSARRSHPLTFKTDQGSNLETHWRDSETVEKLQEPWMPSKTDPNGFLLRGCVALVLYSLAMCFDMFRYSAKMQRRGGGRYKGTDIFSNDGGFPCA